MGSGYISMHVTLLLIFYRILTINMFLPQFFSLTQCGPSLGNSVFGPNSELRTGNFPAADEVPLEFAAADMSLSTLYLHELHHQQVS
jgi:hypothetical protein